MSAHTDTLRALAASIVAEANAIDAAAPAPVPVPVPVPTPPPVTAGTLLRPFASTSPWNTPVPATAKFGGPLPWPSQMAWWINDVTGNPYVNPIYVGQASDPLVLVTYNYTGSTPYSPNGDPQNATRWGRSANTAVALRIPVGVTGAGGGTTGDGNLIIVDALNGIVHDFWQFHRVDDTHATASGYGSSNWQTGTGWGSPSSTPGIWPGGLNAGTTAAGCSKFGGTLRGDQLAAGGFDHCLAFAADLGVIGSPNIVPPAIWGDRCTGSVGQWLHESELLAIPAGTPKPANVTSPIGVAVFNALVKYGARCIDFAGNNTVGLSVDAASITQAQVNVLRSEWRAMGPLMQKVIA